MVLFVHPSHLSSPSFVLLSFLLLYLCLRCCSQLLLLLLVLSLIHFLEHSFLFRDPFVSLLLEYIHIIILPEKEGSSNRRGIDQSCFVCSNPVSSNFPPRSFSFHWQSLFEPSRSILSAGPSLSSFSPLHQPIGNGSSLIPRPTTA